MVVETDTEGEKKKGKERWADMCDEGDTLEDIIILGHQENHFTFGNDDGTLEINPTTDGIYMYKLDDVDGEDDGARDTRTKTAVQLPPLEEQRLHRLTHIPYRAWCEH